MLQNQFVAFPIFAILAVVATVLILRLKKIEQILLSAAIITAPWSGGFWIKALKFDLRLTFFFLIAAFALIAGKKQRFKNNIPQLITIPFFALMGWSLIAATQAFDKAIALGDGAITMCFNFLFLLTIVKMVQKNSDLDFVIKSAFLGLFFTSLLALVQYKVRFFHVGFIDSDHVGFMWWRPSSTFLHPNAFGMYQLIILPIVFRQAILMFKLKNTKLGRNYIILFVISCFTLFLTQNRGSWVGLGVGMLVTVGIDFFRRGSKKTRKVMIRILIAMILLSIVPASKYGPRMYDRMFAGKNAVDKKAETRKLYDVDAWRQLEQHPVFGVGISNVRYYSSIIFTHNLYLLMASETGYPGFLLFMLYMIGHILVANRAMKSKNMYVSTMGSGFLTTMLALLMASYPGPDYGITSQVSSQLWIVSGIMISLLGIEQRVLIQQKKFKQQQLMQKKYYQKERMENEPVYKLPEIPTRVINN